MAIPTTSTDLLIWAVIAVLLALDWYVGGMAYNRPSLSKGDRKPEIRREDSLGERKAA